MKLCSCPVTVFVDDPLLWECVVSSSKRSVVSSVNLAGVSEAAAVGGAEVVVAPVEELPPIEPAGIDGCVGDVMPAGAANTFFLEMRQNNSNLEYLCIASSVISVH